MQVFCKTRSPQVDLDPRWTRINRLTVICSVFIGLQETKKPDELDVVQVPKFHCFIPDGESLRYYFKFRFPQILTQSLMSRR